MALPQSPDALAPETPRGQSQRRQVIALLLLGALLALGLAAGVAWKHGAFARMAQVYFIADDVTGLAPGTTVRMSGFRIGKIADLQMQPDLKVKVVLMIEADTFAHLRSDARADVIREQLRPAAIDLRPGSAEARLPEADPRVGWRRRGTITEIADDLRGRLAPILDDIRQITAVTRERRDDLDTMLRHAREVSEQLAGTAKQMHAMTTELRQRTGTLGAQSERAMAAAQRSIVRLDGVIGRADEGLASVNQRLPAMLDRTQDALGRTQDVLVNLDAVLRDARTISGSAAATLPGMMRGAAPLVDESREMVEGLRQSWPVRSLLPAPAPLLLQIDSHDSAALRAPATP